LDCSLDVKRRLVEADNKQISQRRQCQLLGLNRSGLFYQAGEESSENLELMSLLDEQYTRTPFYGVARMTAWLHQQGKAVNEKRVRRLLRKMGIEAIYPKPRLSQKAPGTQIYPYLLRGVAINRADQVWSTDITYVRLVGGFIYLMAIIDWFSRYVLEWEISVTLDSSFCIAALDRALLRGRPLIFNTDQGSQFTSQGFTGSLLGAGIKISMDGRGRALDNIFVERLWRSVKYEEVYLKDYRTVAEARQGLRNYFEFYNRERLHQSLEYQTPETVYRRGENSSRDHLNLTDFWS
jgi:putative transposase